MEFPERHRTPWTPQDFEQARTMMSAGSSNQEIALSMGRTAQTTAAVLHKMGLHRGANTCLNCGLELIQPPVGRKRRYCDDACRAAGRRSRSNSDRDARLVPGRPCTRCGSPIPLDRQRHSTAVLYCSRVCSQQAWYARRTAQ